MKKLLLFSALLPLSSHAALVDMWLFNDVPVGAVANGTTTTGVNGGVAVIRGASVNSVSTAGGGFVGSGAQGIDLPGGGSATAGYIDLPNGLISTRTSITINVWLRVDSINSWNRVFDFGSSDTGVGSQGGEVFGPGGGGRGQEYILLTAHRGGDPNTQRMEGLTDATSRGTTDTNSVYALGQEQLFTFVWQDNGLNNSTQSWYLNGAFQGSGGVAMNLNQINDVNNWLGRSNWVNDNNTDGTYDQFALYDTAFTPAEVAASFAAGPIPEPSTNLVMAGSLLGLMIRRRRA